MKYIVEIDGPEIPLGPDTDLWSGPGAARRCVDFIRVLPQAPPIVETFVKDAIRTEAPADSMALLGRLGSRVRVIHALFGKMTELGELVDAFKKEIFYGKELDITNIKEELGDGWWYDAILMDLLDTTPEEVMTRVIDKLRVRYPEKFQEHQALTRDLDAERQALEGTT